MAKVRWDGTTLDAWQWAASLLQEYMPNVMGGKLTVYWNEPRMFVCPECGKKIFAEDYHYMGQFLNGRADMACPKCNTTWISGDEFAELEKKLEIDLDEWELE